MSALAELNRPPPYRSSRPTSPKRKRIVLEPEPDFDPFDEQPPSDLDDDDFAPTLAHGHSPVDELDAIDGERDPRPGTLDATLLNASTSTHAAFTDDEATRRDASDETGSRADAKGKGRMRFEEDDEFGADDQPLDLANLPRPVAPVATTSARPLAPLHDYTTRYGTVANLDLTSPRSSLASGYIECAPIQATRLDGKKVLLKRKKRLESWVGNPQAEDPLALAKLAQSMLERPYQRLVQSIEDDATMIKKQREADATSAAFGTDKSGNQVMLGEEGKPVETQLWTDRYRPKKFTDLLGDERVHRQALSWLKEWDSCVFKGTAKASAAAQLKKDRRHDKKRQWNGGSSGTAASTGGFEEAVPDPYGRPHEKVLLLSGPPGLGKTTLAHVLARQAGYQVLEINGSDDRTGRVVEERIRNALDSTALSLGWSDKEKRNGMGNTSGGGARPTCVVVDEVDGAAAGGEGSFVKTLVKLVSEGSSTKRPTTRKNGKGKKDRPLLRPIICICNDLYAPVLRPLRALAKIIRFSPPTNTMLTKRLRTICQAEGMKAENKHLTLLVETAEGDLRSCLNTLQFIKRKGTVVDEQAIRSTSLGMKDTGTSSIQVVDRLFKKPPRKKGVVDDGRYVTRIVRDLQTSGEYEKIAQGCFENYLGSRETNNESFPVISDALEWMFLFDRLDGRLRSDRDYELMGYLPYAFVPWYPLFSSQTPNTVELPKTDYEMYLQRTAHEEVATAFFQSLPVQLRVHFTSTQTVTELLPLFNRIVSPDLKPVNSSVVKTDERERMLRVVRSLIATKVSFVIDKNEDGQLSYKLDPPIDVFVHFEGKRATDVAPGRYAVRQMLQREIEAELLRRGGVPEGVRKDASAIISAYQTKPVAAAIAPEVKQAVDFFGRVIVPKALTASQEAAILAEPPRKKVRQTMYKFNEGFSNAVRTTKRVLDFLA
ncbi:hypothetical protein JCM10212_002936 [Sporobolomyces blumeae]